MQITVEWVLEAMNSKLRERFSVEPKRSTLCTMIEQLVDEQGYEDVDGLPIARFDKQC